MNNSEKQCITCRTSYQGADLVLRCRENGVECECIKFCVRYEREAGTDDHAAKWCSAWRYEKEARN